GDARGDVHIYAEVIAPEPARPAPVNPGPHARCVTIDLNRVERPIRGERRVDGFLHIEERGHEAVAEALDDLAVVLVDGRLLSRPNGTEQFERGSVAGLERPGREAHQVREEQRELNVTPAPTGGLG